MVLQTSHTGNTAEVGQGQSQDVAQVAAAVPKRYPNVYESKRILENWELMKIAHETAKVNVKHYHMCQELLNRDRVTNIFSACEAGCKGRTEGIYQVLIGLKAWRGGLLYLGDLAKVMKKYEYADLAESFPP